MVTWAGSAKDWKSRRVVSAASLQPSGTAQGFVSNKDAEAGGDKGDPMEGLLYQLFVATSERADMAALAQLLSVDVGRMTQAVSIACRLGFGTNISAPSPLLSHTHNRFHHHPLLKPGQRGPCCACANYDSQQQRERPDRHRLEHVAWPEQGRHLRSRWCLLGAASRKQCCSRIGHLLCVDCADLNKRGWCAAASADPGRDNKQPSVPVNPFVLQLSELDADANSPK